MPSVKLKRACLVQGTAYNPGDQVEVTYEEMAYFTGAVGLAHAVEVVPDASFDSKPEELKESEESNPEELPESQEADASL